MLYNGVYMAEWLAVLPHSKNVVSSNPSQSELSSFLFGCSLQGSPQRIICLHLALSPKVLSISQKLHLKSRRVGLAQP